MARALAVTHAAPALSKTEKQLLAEALRRGEEARDTMEDALVGFGRWVLVNIFDDDAAAALDGKRSNPVWHELLRRAGGPTLHLSRKLLYVGLQIAAHDKRIADQTWRNLEPGRKELLLPLGSEPLMRDAAQHVTAMKLTHRSTRDYVRNLLSEQPGAKKPKARLTRRSLMSKLKAVRALSSNAMQQKIRDLVSLASPKERAEILREAEELRALAQDLARLARKGG